MADHPRIDDAETLWVVMLTIDGRYLPATLPHVMAIACTSCPCCAGPGGWMRSYAEKLAQRQGCLAEVVPFQRGAPLAVFGATAH